MAFRKLEIEGRFVSPPETTVRFDGRTYTARAAEPLGIALLAHGVRVLGRSPKYHRPRGMFCGRGTCGRCLCRVDGLPSRQVCSQEARSGSVVRSQNVLGTARLDLLAAIDWLFPEGLSHHRLLTESTPLNRIAVAVARQLAGLGRLPDAESDRDRMHGSVASVSGNGRSLGPQVHEVQVAVVGAGPAGVAAAERTSAAGLDTVVLEARAQPFRHGGQPPRVPVVAGARVVGFYDDRQLVAVRGNQQVRVRAEAVVLATGGHEQAPACPGNDLPGVLSGRAAVEIMRWGVLPGRRVVVAVEPGSGPSVSGQALAMVEQTRLAGAEVVAMVGLEGGPTVPAWPQDSLAAIDAGAGASARRARLAGTGEQVECDAVIAWGRPLPAYELARQMGVDTPFEPSLGGFVPAHDADTGQTARKAIFVTGELAGVPAQSAAEHGAKVGAAVADKLTAGNDREQTGQTTS